MSSAGQYLVFDSSNLSTVLLLWGIYIKKCISPVRICRGTRNARNASTKFRKTSESKNLVKYSPYGECDVFPTANRLIILKMPSRESREGIRIRDRISISYNNGRIFAFGEDSLTLRLASELADLRAANADRRRFRGSVRIVAIPANTKPRFRVAFLLAGMAGFGPTNAGVKVPCLTAWRHPIAVPKRFALRELNCF